MTKLIFRFINSFLLSICIIVPTLFIKVTPSLATQISPDINEDNPLGIVIEQTNKDIEGTKSSIMPDLGDDQAFPFIPGFGKNSGKD